MGLDITALSKIKKVDDADEEFFCVHPHFKERADEGFEDGYYVGEQELDFRAGSYAGYNRWREELAELAGYPPDPHYGDKPHSQYVWNNVTEGPFYELIHFADNEGVIGSVVSKKLLADFIKYDDAAKEKDEYFYDRYQLWKRAFELAADDGVVNFC